MRTVTLFDVRLGDYSHEELVAQLEQLCSQQHVSPALVVTPNPEMLLAARKNPEFRNVLLQSALALPDGVALRFAAAALCGVSGLRRHTGVDVLPDLAQSAKTHKLTLVLLGGTAFSLSRTEQYFATLIPGVKIVAIEPGIIDEDVPTLQQSIIDQLERIGPCVIAVALGQGRGRTQGKQEFVMDDIARTVLNARVLIGVGGAFDMYSGKIRRSPRWVQRLGFEWFWRLCWEPWRLMRIVRAVIVFPSVVVWDTLKRGIFVRAAGRVARELFLHFIRR